jgi:hypothetical protein
MFKRFGVGVWAGFIWLDIRANDWLCKDDNKCSCFIEARIHLEYFRFSRQRI